MIYSILMSILILLVVSILSLFLGQIFVNRYKLFNGVTSSYFSIGIITYFFITFLFLLPFVVFKTKLEFLGIVEIVKNLSIIIFILRNQSEINFRNTNYKKITWFFIFGIFTTILINIVVSKLDGGTSLNNLFQNKYAVDKNIINSYDSHGFEGKLSNSQEFLTWVHWNAIIWYIKINPEFFTYWISKFFITMIGLSIVMTFLYKYIRNIFIAPIIALSLLLLTNYVYGVSAAALNNDYSYIFIILFIFTALFINWRNEHLSKVLIVAAFCAWTMNYSMIIIYPFMIFSLFISRLALKQSNSLALLCIEAIPELMMIGIVYWDQLLGIILIGAIVLSGLLWIIYRIDKTNPFLEQSSLWLIKKKYFFLAIMLFVFILVNVILISTNKTDFWFGFDPHNIIFSFGNEANNLTSWLYYSSYLIIIGLSIFWVTKSKSTTIKLFSLFILSFVVFFYSPISINTWKLIFPILDTNTNYLKSVFIFPFVIILTSLIFGVKIKNWRKVVFTLLPIASISLTMATIDYSLYSKKDFINGSFKNVDNIVDWLNRNEPNKSIGGDIYNWAYKYNGDFNETLGNAQIWIIHVDNITPDIDFASYGYKEIAMFDSYQIFSK
ncbi:MAG: hypothetical protein NC236_00310 [Mycoplasma sp.]|nr:hypothetical protein [Mycoplasma sp.]